MTSDSRIQLLSIEDEMKGSYLTYAMSVIIQRALPDVRDGLKPSQRRILVAMNDLNLGPRSKHRKCAKIAGDTSGNYHPHGESVIYPTLVRLAQPFSMSQMLIDGQGNFGSIDGDPPAAMRYTEARMTQATTQMLEDIDKNTVDFEPNYDETREEPTVLPSKFPNLLINGGSGIAVGMSTNFAPHNAGEVLRGILKVLENPEITIAELMETIPGPDFPTGGLISGKSGIWKAYNQGRGIVSMRARTHIEEGKSSKKFSIVVTEIPYQVTKSKLAIEIADGVKDGRLSGVADVRDESDRKGIRLVVELKRGEDPDIILNQLFKFTQMRTSFGIQQIALQNGRPRTLNLRDLLLAYRDHRIEVIRRRSRFLLEKAEYRAHILKGLLIALDNIDRIIEIIRASKTVDDARDGLQAEFSFTKIQADAILQMRLQRLTGLERQKIEDELEKVLAEIAFHREVLTSHDRVISLIREDVEGLLEIYKGPRRSEITADQEEIDIQDMIENEQVVVTMSNLGYIKRSPISEYRSQNRGGKGKAGGTTRDGDFITRMFVANTHDSVMFFTSYGKAYWLKVFQVPEMGRLAKGRAIVNLLPLDKDEEILSTIPVDKYDERMIVFATKRGYVKKTALKAFARPKKTGLIAINIDEGDELIGVSLLKAQQHLILSSASGKSIRFNEEDAREMGRGTRGVKGISLAENDKVVGMAVVADGGCLLTLCENGYGKQTNFEAYRPQRRGGMGLIDIRTTERNGQVVKSLCIVGDQDVMIMTAKGMLVRTSLSEVRPIGRNTQGVRLISVNADDYVIGAEVVEKEEVDEEDALNSESSETHSEATDTAVDSSSDSAGEDSDDSDNKESE